MAGISGSISSEWVAGFAPDYPLYRWRSDFASCEGASFPGNGNKKQTEEQKEIARLQKELADIKMERDILKKAVGIFSKSDGRYTGL